MTPNYPMQELTQNTKCFGPKKLSNSDFIPTYLSFQTVLIIGPSTQLLLPQREWSSMK